MEDCGLRQAGGADPVARQPTRRLGHGDDLGGDARRLQLGHQRTVLGEDDVGLDVTRKGRQKSQQSQLPA